MATKRRDVLAQLGFGSDSFGGDSTADTLARLRQEQDNLTTRLGFEGVDTTAPPVEESLWLKALKGLNLPGAAIRSVLAEATDDQQGVNLKRAFSKKNLWDKQTEFSKVARQLGIDPQNKFASGAVNFIGNAVTDPFTFIGGGITNGLKLGLPFGKQAALTTRGLAQVAKIPEGIQALRASKFGQAAIEPAVEAVGKMFVNGFGRNQQLNHAYRGLRTSVNNQVRELSEDIMDISRRNKLTGEEQKALFRIVDEPDYGASLGLTGDLTPTTEIASLAPDIQERVMKAIPRFGGGGNLRPELLSALNELQDITRNVATKSEAELGWLNAGNLRPDYVKRSLLTETPSQLFNRGSKSVSVQDASLLPRTTTDPVSVLNEARKAEGKVLFDDNMLSATFQRNADAIQATQAFKWVSDQLVNPQLGMKLDDFVMKNIDNLPQDQALKQIDSLTNLRHGEQIGDLKVWEGGGKLKSLGKHVISQDMWDVLNAVDKHYINSTSEGVKAFVKAFDWATNKWRPLVTLANPAWMVNNGIGNLWNMYLGGIDSVDMPTRLRQGYDAFKGKSGAFTTQLGTVGLEDALGLAFEKGAIGNTRIWSEPGVKALRDKLAVDTATNKGNILKQGMDRYLSFMENTASTVEDSMKMSLFIDNLSKMKPNMEIFEMSGREAALKEMAERATLHVKRHLFDYGDLTDFERNVMRRAMPFWSWTRNNLPLQIRSVIEQPEKFARFGQVKRGIEGLSSDNGDKNRPPYLDEAIRTPFKMGGTNVYWNPRLPGQDLGRVPFIGSGDTGREFFGGVNPLIKLPLEMTFNKSLFTGKPIQRYEGETTEVIGGKRVPTKLAYAVNSSLGVLGKTGAAAQAFAPDATATDTLRLARTFFPGLYTYDAADAELSGAYTERQRLQDLLRKRQDETGRKVPTLQALGLGR